MEEDRSNLFIDDRKDLDSLKEFMKTHTPEEIHQLYLEMAEKYNFKPTIKKSEEK